jgi:hypothetical protein
MAQKRSGEQTERELKALQASGLTRAEYCRRRSTASALKLSAEVTHPEIPRTRQLSLVH